MASLPDSLLSLTPQWFSDVLQADVRECRSEQIGVGVGLLGRLYRVHLTGSGVPDSVVVKLPTLDLQARKTVCEAMDFYLREVRFYQDIGVGNPLPPARPYYAAFDESTHDFVLVLDDLGRLRMADQTAGCSVADAEAVVDAIARHHAHWWDNDRLAGLDWLRPYCSPPFPEAVANNFEASWPGVVDGLGDDLSPEIRAFGDRFASLVPWYLEQIARPPHTFVHGDLRLDQLFFAVEPDDPPVTALDWQVTGKGRGAYDMAYFLSQSLGTETRRANECELVQRYAARLAEHGIDYPAAELKRDYRLTTALCFAYPVIGIGRVDVANERQRDLISVMLTGAIAAIEDHDAMSLGPD